MTITKTEGVILQTVKYRDHDLILTVFTEVEGIIGLIWKRALSSKNRQGAAISPLTAVEIVYSKGKGQLFHCHEISPRMYYNGLRENLACLNAGVDIIRTLKHFLPQQKAAPALYQLLIAYLDKIPSFPNPKILTASFRLKVLRHEGISPFESPCSICYAPSHGRAINQNGSFCLSHRPPGSICFTSDEEEIINHLIYNLSFQNLRQINLEESLWQRIVNAFDILTEAPSL